MPQTGVDEFEGLCGKIQPVVTTQGYRCPHQALGHQSIPRSEPLSVQGRGHTPGTMFAEYFQGGCQGPFNVLLWYSGSVGKAGGSDSQNQVPGAALEIRWPVETECRFEQFPCRFWNQ
jgi:hypothetical protein